MSILKIILIKLKCKLCHVELNHEEFEAYSGQCRICYRNEYQTDEEREDNECPF